MNKGINNGSVDGANKRTKEDVGLNILNLLKDADNPLSTSDLSSKLKKAWHTIDRACLKLQIDSKIDGFKVGKMNLWRVK